MRLPDFLIVGAAKSGTTSLYHYLKQHPHIFMPENKEPSFFTFAGKENTDEDVLRRLRAVRNLDEYCVLFKKAPVSHIAGEASTTYLYIYNETIENIKKFHPRWKELKIIIILRNPVERAFSHYLNDMAAGWIDFSFDEVIGRWKSKHSSTFYNYINYGFYYNQIRAYKDHFDQVKVFLFDDIKTSSLQLVQDLYIFLDADASFIPKTELKYNVSGVPKYKFLGKLIYNPNLLKKIAHTFLPTNVRLEIKNRILKSFSRKLRLEKSQKGFLREVYQEDILRLQRLINKDLSHWLKN